VAGVVVPRESRSNPPGASAPSLSEKDIFIFPGASKSSHPERLTAAVEIFFISIHSAVDESDDPIHAISFKMISRVVDDADAFAGNIHGVAGSVAVGDDATEDDDEDEFAATVLSSKLPSAAGADATLDCAFATLFFADDGGFAGASTCEASAPASAAASSPPTSEPITASDDDALSAAKRSPSEMVSIPALFIPSALLIAEG
jgi:hypothetical protein